MDKLPLPLLPTLEKVVDFMFKSNCCDGDWKASQTLSFHLGVTKVTVHVLCKPLLNVCLCLCCGGRTEGMRKNGHHFMPSCLFLTMMLFGTFGMTNRKQHRSHLQSWHAPKLPILGRNNAGGAVWKFLVLKTACCSRNFKDRMPRYVSSWVCLPRRVNG